MKLNYDTCYVYLLRQTQKVKRTIISNKLYHLTRFHYKSILFTFVFFILMLFCISLYLQKQLNVLSQNLIFKGTNASYYISFNITNNDLVKIPSLNELKVKWVQRKIERMSKKMKKFMVNKVANVEELPLPNYQIHIFYYTWFRNHIEDGLWQSWNKVTIPENKYVSETNTLPPEDIYSSFYPYLGCYSSRNASVIDHHIKIIRKAGIGVIVISWIPPVSKDILHLLLDVALKYDIKIAFKIYFIKSGTKAFIVNQIKQLILNVGDHPSVYLLKKDDKMLPVFYIFESYKINAYIWRDILSEKGNFSVRKTKYDGIFIGHLADLHHGLNIKHGFFDGIYTYSSGNGLTYGSSWKNWKTLAKFCKENALIFVPSIGPGYSDIMSMKSTRHRLNGNYYEVGWRSALSVKPRFISISSFNHWQDGSQIEPAKPKKTPLRSYLDYEPEGPYFYINLTRWWIKQFPAAMN